MTKNKTQRIIEATVSKVGYRLVSSDSQPIGQTKKLEDLDEEDLHKIQKSFQSNDRETIISFLAENHAEFTFIDGEVQIFFNGAAGC